MSANNNREGGLLWSPDPNRAYARCMGGSRCLHSPGTCTADPRYQAWIAHNRPEFALKAEAAEAAPEPTPTPPATAADINMLWAVIDELKARIDALEGEGRRAASGLAFRTMVTDAFGPGGRSPYEPQRGATLRGAEGDPE